MIPNSQHDDPKANRGRPSHRLPPNVTAEDLERYLPYIIAVALDQGSEGSPLHRKLRALSARLPAQDGAADPHRLARQLAPLFSRRVPTTHTVVQDTLQTVATS